MKRHGLIRRKPATSRLWRKLHRAKRAGDMATVAKLSDVIRRMG